MYSDYPEAASNAAKRALKYKEENGSNCGTTVGWTRANQLASRESLSEDVIKRTYSFLSRSAQYKDVPYDEGCGGIMYDAWGGPSMLAYTRKKVKEMEKEIEKERAYLGEIDGVPVYSTKEEAAAAAEKMGCSGTHQHQTDDGSTVFMPCASHDDATNGYRSDGTVVEQRSAESAIEVREAKEGTTISGYAAVFNSITDLGSFREQIAPTAFDRVLTEAPDTVALLNHDSNLVLGRTTSGTLKLSVDEVGLRYELQLGSQSYAKDLAESMRRGDINKSSFAFTIERESWTDDVRTVEEVRGLYDVSVVTRPAYNASSASLRAEDKAACACQTKKEIKERATVTQAPNKAAKLPQTIHNHFNMKNSDELKSLRSNKLTELNALVTVAEKENRDYTDAEVQRQEQLNADVTALDKQIERAEATEANVARFAQMGATTPKAETVEKSAMKQKYNLQRALSDAAQGRLSGVEAEMHQEALREASAFGIQLRGNVCIPQSFIEQRNVYGVDSGQSGVDTGVTTVATETADVVAALRPNPVIQQLGATQLTGFVGDIKLPTLPNDTASLPVEGAAATAFSGAMGSKTLSPQRFACEMQLTKEALNQSTGNMQDVIARDFARAIGNSIDRFAFARLFNGSVEGTQLAIVPTDADLANADAQLVKASESGTNDLAATTVADVMRLWAAITANGVGDGASFVMTPAVAAALMQAGSTGTGGNAALVGNNLFGHNAIWTANIPTLTGTNVHADAVLVGGAADVDLGASFISDVMFYGDFSQIFWATWGGLSLTVDPFSGASSGTVKIVADQYFDARLRESGHIGFMLASDAVVAGADA